MTPASVREEVAALIESIRQLFHLLRAAGGALHGGQGLSASMRGVLEALAASPATVPGLARERGVSRQAVQRIVDDLLDRRLVRLEDNPAHKRSPRVALTPRGEAACRAMSEREKLVLARLARDLSAAEAHTALRALSKMKSGLTPLARRAPAEESQQ